MSVRGRVWYSDLMVKREHIKSGTIIQIRKPPPEHPGPSFRGKLATFEKLEVVGPPRTSGGLNLVQVKRLRTEEIFDVLYAFVTNFCTLAQ